MRVKICGITQADQGSAIARLGATALGFICVPTSPRYIPPEQIRTINQQIPPDINRIGVFANHSLVEIVQIVEMALLSGVQLHGNESPEFCRQLRSALPNLEIIKALRIRSTVDLAQTDLYLDCIDTLLLDAYHPQQLGGTGKTLNWAQLQQFHPPCPWFLAGGLTPNNIELALSWVRPSGIDLSSGVERQPGDKDLKRIAELFDKLNRLQFAFTPKQLESSQECLG
ncbi:phosphoribosylanthranilate isomerase [Desertifilum sp. FACHB-1129]|uniref:N-(5'-phosphoribosyl)anthranilate isomerase n=1 Tax=Desertifilum tharense IPPAS B-1220 TaxID=1781255 RepID=A0A1E5QQ75_9CYAN|nr:MULTISPECIES: phosphoribosylanthranilate isomerase [unclassified Desertifilum]MDA0209178.1 phosphoribosylanthranilate isomerase [Cyanobacteria bacterium FC1]OEJ76819.1 N-(5'-phosphoribosyl)anthranilate isomerase [Desertifilum tharense IPPAS B-1220]MBD2311832.1 phosphoribosylanthranilate isomerase [Desertifilum sp. FACHB-1129]MBD2322976.1 phosphoribosylanthranilate isomerase [Desertifilum sp. FACHB-866]MBD2333407.1 phosphoribosylanthranilate isomerase [Desertifilum sp. FACHB-868]